MIRRVALALLLLPLACVTSTSHSRTGPGLFPFGSGASAAEGDEEAPAGLTLDVESIEAGGAAVLLLRNYSNDSFVFYGRPDRPKYVVEEEYDDTHARHTVSSWVRGQKTHEVPAGERVELKVNAGIGPGRVRIGIRHHEFGYIVWTPWMQRGR